MDPAEKPPAAPARPPEPQPKPQEKQAITAPKPSIFDKPPSAARPPPDRPPFAAKLSTPAKPPPAETGGRPAEKPTPPSLFRPILAERAPVKEATPQPRASPDRDPRRQATADAGKRQYRISTDGRREVKVASHERYLDLIKETPPRASADPRAADAPPQKLSTPHKVPRPPSRLPGVPQIALQPPAALKRMPPPDPGKKINIVLATDLAAAKQRREREREIQMVSQLPLSPSSSRSHESEAKEEPKPAPDAREQPAPGAQALPAQPDADQRPETVQPSPKQPQPILAELEEVTPGRRRQPRPAGRKPLPKEYVYEEREPKRLQQPLQVLGVAEERQARLAAKVRAIRSSMSSVSGEKVDEMIGYLSQVIARDKIPEDEDIRQFEQRFRGYLSSISPADLIHLYQLLHLQVQIGR